MYGILRGQRRRSALSSDLHRQLRLPMCTVLYVINATPPIEATYTESFDTESFNIDSFNTDQSVHHSANLPL